jgi:hypothetical protein
VGVVVHLHGLVIADQPEVLAEKRGRPWLLSEVKDTDVLSGCGVERVPPFELEP